MAITFGGLATGLDTGSIISELMSIERTPITRLENDKAFFTNRLAVFSKLDGKLSTLQEKAEAIDTPIELNSPSVDSSSESYLSVTAGGKAQLGTYQISVVALAQQQKDVSQGYVDKTTNSFGTGTLNLTVAGELNEITIDSENNSLEGIAEAINDADLGVSATIINDGTASPYRLILTGETVSDSFSLDSSELTGGTDLNLAMSPTQTAQQAHVRIDGIDIYSDSNSIDEAIPGLTLDLAQADETVTTTITIDADKDAAQGKIKDFVTAYNDIINYIASQKTADWGNDSTFRSVKRRMQDLLVSQQSGLGTFSSLSELGFETQKDGTISLNSTTLSEALEEDYEGAVALFTGDDETSGISSQFADYLDLLTDSADGIYAGRKETTDSNVKRIEQRITSMEARLELKEETLRAQFAAMEQLVSGLNSQGNYLLQQLSSMPTIGGSSSN
ncbi:flagellar hook-associated protein 2 [Malonomonas rubra DSM 5091]|uniref:Flagellar hook-associated protein 2 n=1 Tax=Malonomonas rubra DSM 5091 TaxID=1122189 RepID=A0A1M6LBA2_MALRU|nr:flagellar filament capping protein FliD [Malonomonas rubra]SHJ68433.1 flagellar hook-associated protein 2 [Malonomonas rubra DSM 5091]